MIRRKHLFVPVPIALAVIALPIAGCSASGASSTASSATTASAAAAGAGTSKCVANANAEVAKYSGPSTFSVPALPKPVSQLSLGSSPIAFVADTSVPVLASNYSGFSAAAATIGAKIKLYNTSGTVPATDQAVSEAVAAKSSVIVIDAEPLDLIPPAITQASNAHIPIVTLYEPPAPGSNMPDVKYSIQLPGSNTGTAAIWYALAATQCHLVLGDLLQPDQGQSVNATNAIKSIMSSQCPSTCSIASIVDETNAQGGTSYTQPVVSSMVAAHPNIQYIYSNNSGDAPYILAALKAAGKLNKVGVVMAAGLAFQQVAIKDKSSGLSAIIENPGLSFAGWMAMDAALRVLGGSTGTEFEPQRLVVNSSVAASNAFTFSSTYQSTYPSVWKG